MTLSGYTVRPAAPPESQGTATTALVLGLIGVPALLACGLGVPLGLTGLVLGIIALRRGRPRRIAVTAVVVCITTLALGAAMIAWLLVNAAACGDRVRYPDDTARRHCIERKFPFTGGTAEG